MSRIPLTVGVTGHIDLREQDRDILCRTVTQELERIRDRYPHTPLRMINSLAAGADPFRKNTERIFSMRTFLRITGGRMSDFPFQASVGIILIFKVISDSAASPAISFLRMSP